MLHYNPRHVSSSTMLIFRRSNCIITASRIVTFCKRLYSTPIESGLQSNTMLHGQKNIKNEEYNVMVNSEELIGTAEHLML
jgi:hypothetical protein